jgi:outer membrane receptor protein involved in Fe transport
MNSNFDLGFFVNNLTNVTAPVGSSVNSAGWGYFSVFYTEPRMFGVRLRYAMGGER